MTASTRRVLLALVVLGGLMAATPGAQADHTWGSYHWYRTANPLPLTLDDNVSADWDSYLDTAIADWDVSNVLTLAEGVGAANPTTCKPVAGEVQVCNAAYGTNGWLGIASIWASGSHITQATVKLNDSYYSMEKYDTVAWRNLVMCQEVGHVFGLDHQDENFNNANLGTCMDYTNDPESNQHPNAHDHEQLDLIYKHLDGTTTTTPKPGKGNGKRQDDWGRAVSMGGEGGHADVFEKDLGNGQKVITHVFWADHDDGHEHTH